jgi:hypothetical protein
MSDQPAGVEELRIANSLRDQLCELMHCLMLTKVQSEKLRSQLSQKLGFVTRDGEPA